MDSRRMTALILLGLALLPGLSGAAASDWATLQALKPGQMIGIIQSDQKRVEGPLEQVTESAITLRTGGEVTVPKENVIRVYRKPRANRLLRVAIGAAIGVAAGAILSGTAGERFRNEGQDVPAAAWIGGGAGMGAGVGALTGGGYQTLYQRSAKP